MMTGANAQIVIHSITTSRQPANEVHTLDGAMFNVRTKLLNPANFGPGGTYPESVTIIDEFATSNSLTAVTSLPTDHIVFVGMFNTMEPSLAPFTSSELDSLYTWSMRGGKVIIGSHATFPNLGTFRPALLDSLWGFATEAGGGYLRPTALGSELGLFAGPFGVADSVAQGGSIIGHFSTLPAHALLLADDLAHQASMFLDCTTGDLIYHDTDVFTSLGQASEGNGIVEHTDRLWANMIVMVHELPTDPDRPILDACDIRTALVALDQPATVTVVPSIADAGQVISVRTGQLAVTRLRVLDSTGREVYSATNVNNVEEVRLAAPGWYMVRVDTDDGKTVTQRLVVR